MKKTIFLRALLIVLTLFSSYLNSRPGMGGSYRSSGTSSSSRSSYSSTSTSSSSYRSSGSSSTSSSSSDSSPSIRSSDLDFSVSVVTSPTWDIKLKLQKEGSISVEESFSPSEIKVNTYVQKLDPDILKGIITISPPDREKTISRYLLPDLTTLNYKVENVFHPIYGSTLSYINLQQPINNKTYTIFIEQEDGLEIPSVDFWVATGGSSNYDGTNPYQYFTFEKELELNKKYEFTNDEYRHTLYFYIKYPGSNSPISTPIPLPESSVSYDTKIKLKKSGLSQISTKMDISLTENPTTYLDLLPQTTEYYDRKGYLDIAYPSYIGDWEVNLSGQNRFPTLKSNSSSLQLDYETYGNFTEKDGILEFDFHIPYVPTYTHEVQLKSYNIQFELPEGVEEDKVKLSLYSAVSGYVGDGDPAVVLHPIPFIKNGSIYSIQSVDPISLPGRLVVNVEIPASSLSTSTLLHIAFLVLQAIKSPLNVSLYIYSIPVYLFVLLFGFVLFKSFQKKKPDVTLQSSQKEALLIEKDPKFSISDFQKRANQIAVILQSSWNSSAMEKSRPYLSSGVFSRMTAQLELLEKKDGLINKMSEFQTLSSSVEGYALENSYFTIHLRMNFSAKDVTLPKTSTTSQIQSELHSANPQEYSEMYSFTRKLSATTEVSKSLLEGKCPSCGNSADFKHPTVKCAYCGNIYNSGETDWVLSEITQMVEWKGVSDFSTTEYSSQVLEDRASSLFWKYLKAKTLGSQIFISREADSSFLQKESFSVSEIYIPVVGAVDLKKLQKTKDSYLAELVIKWSSASVKEGEITGKESKLFMVRKLTAKDTGFSESSCLQCGAPYPELDSPSCEYCNTEIPKVVDDWILSDIKHIHGDI